MTVTHRTLEGGWALCSAPEVCELLFHLSDMTPEQAAAMPMHVLLPLLVVMDPPDRVRKGGARFWYDQAGQIHRDYDLPAIVWADGSMFWYQHGQQHRANRQPAEVRMDGTLMWWEHNKLLTANYNEGFVDPREEVL